MDNKLRIKRVKEGIKMLESGKDPLLGFNSIEAIEQYYGLSRRGWYLLECNGVAGEKDLTEANGFIDGLSHQMDKKLHNWKCFLELIEKMK